MGRETCTLRNPVLLFLNALRLLLPEPSFLHLFLSFACILKLSPLLFSSRLYPKFNFFFSLRVYWPFLFLLFFLYSFLTTPLSPLSISPTLPLPPFPSLSFRPPLMSSAFPSSLYFFKLPEYYITWQCFLCQEAGFRGVNPTRGRLSITSLFPHRFLRSRS